MAITLTDLKRELKPWILSIIQNGGGVGPYLAGGGTANKVAYYTGTLTLAAASHLTVGTNTLTIQPSADNATTFRVLDAAGTSYLVVDTLNGYAGYIDPGGYINLGTNDASIVAYNSTATRAGLSVQSDNNGSGQYNYHTLLTTTTAAGSGRFGTLGMSLGSDIKVQIRWEQNSSYSEGNTDGSLAIWTRKTNMERAATFIGTNGYTLLNITRGSTLIGYALGATTTYKLDVAGTLRATGQADLDSIQFELTPASTTPAEGRLYWNANDGTLDLGMPGGNVVNQLGQELFLPRRVKNTTVSDLTNGALVYISGGDGTNAYIAPAKADAAATATKTIAMLTEDIDANQRGYATILGLVRGDATQPIDTSAYAPGTELFLSASTAGAWTDTPPNPPNWKVSIGTVFRQHATEGAIIVNIKHYELQTPAIVSKTADYTLTADDYTVLVSCSSANLTMTLPAAASNSGRVYNIKKIDSTAYTVIIDANGSETIDGQLTQTLYLEDEVMTIQSDGTGWWIL